MKKYKTGDVFIHGGDVHLVIAVTEQYAATVYITPDGEHHYMPVGHYSANVFKYTEKDFDMVKIWACISDNYRASVPHPLRARSVFDELLERAYASELFSDEDKMVHTLSKI